MILTESSLLKWPVENPETGDVCPCEEDRCEHAIDIKDYHKLDEGLIVNAMWPFEGNYFYPGMDYETYVLVISTFYTCSLYDRV